ncbi:unnamed protein product [Ceratitis capitata]|uniref:(Mediterranean fruit fly) hypothetical protein n=1 Tax=Ceratitis capitata TaxID=7213 RepID=A0A811UC08_CERCA|nr:unnamed protein product [Ceratitis capitata]
MALLLAITSKDTLTLPFAGNTTIATAIQVNTTKSTMVVLCQHNHGHWHNFSTPISKRTSENATTQSLSDLKRLQGLFVFGKVAFRRISNYESCPCYKCEFMAMSKCIAHIHTYAHLQQAITITVLTINYKAGGISGVVKFQANQEGAKNKNASGY